MTLTNVGAHVQFGWRSNPLGKWGQRYGDGHDPVRTWDDPLSAAEVVDEIIQQLDLDTESTLAGVEVQSLGSLFE